MKVIKIKSSSLLSEGRGLNFTTIVRQYADGVAGSSPLFSATPAPAADKVLYYLYTDTNSTSHSRPEASWRSGSGILQ